MLGGCAGYQVGPVNGAVSREKSVQVVPFANKTLQPHLSDEVTSELRRELSEEGTYKLVSHDNGDIIISGTVTSYTRQALSFQPSDNQTVKDYRVGIRAQVVAKERGSGKVLFDQPVNGFTLVRIGADLTSDERQAMPLLAQDLSRRIVSMLTEGSW